RPFNDDNNIPSKMKSWIAHRELDSDLNYIVIWSLESSVGHLLE
ncbi:387_t:CDS:2, partial [Funneliformis geosporum]